MAESVQIDRVVIRLTWNQSSQIEPSTKKQNSSTDAVEVKFV
jgi:hypothetical protein